MSRPGLAEISRSFQTAFSGYRSEMARGIPMSVHERYERELAEIRRQIRKARRTIPGKRLGDLLLEQGVLDEGKLERALAEQKRHGRKKLLGEVLVDLGFIEADAVSRAVEAQAVSEGPSFQVRS